MSGNERILPFASNAATPKSRSPLACSFVGVARFCKAFIKYVPASPPSIPLFDKIPNVEAISSNDWLLFAAIGPTFCIASPKSAKPADVLLAV